MDLAIQDLPRRRIAYLEHRGPYWKIGETFRRVGPAAKAAGHSEAVRGDMVGVYFDNPQEVAEADLRSWAGIFLPEGAAVPEGLSEGWLEGGRHAAGVHMGPYDTMMESWIAIYEALPAQGLQPGMSPPFEHYRNDCDEVPPEEIRTDILIPIV